MNTKKAKRLRRETGYQWEPVTKRPYKKMDSGVIEIHETSKSYLYREAKKEARNG